MTVHLQLAAITKCPEFEMEQEEAKKLADAAASVASHYDLTIDPKHAAWAKLYGTIGVIYGTRLIAIRARKKMERADKVKPAAPEAGAEPSPGDGNVVNLRPSEFSGGIGANLDNDRPAG